MTPRRHALAAALAVAAVVALAPLALVTPSAGADDTPAPPETSGTATTVAVTDARFAWGLNDESNNKAFAPGTYNFMSAGTVPDPGRGNQNVVAPGVWQGTSTKAWWATEGRVTLQKARPGGGFATATFAGLSRDVDGQPLTRTTGPFSQHRIVIDGGTGILDREAGTATIRWTGSFSVLYYSGYSFFTITDPVLSVTPSTAVVRATLSGYASSRDDTSVWEAIDPQDVVLAELPRTAVDLTAAGFTAQPAYLGVRHEAESDDLPQVRDGGSWGAFPSSFLRFMHRAGASAFWYSTGGASDAHKVPKPISVSYSASDPVEPTGTPTATSTPPTPTTTLNPEPPSSPTASVTATETATETATVTASPSSTPAPAAPGVPVPSAPTGPPSPAPVGGSVPTATPAAMSRAAEVIARPATSALPAPGPDRRWTWWLGSALLLGAAALTLLGTPSKGQR